MTDREFQEAKKLTPSGMNSVEWEAVSVDIRERSFFMACVAKAEILQIFKDETEKYIRGDQSEAEARRALREKLTAAGYAPEPGKEGSIKDLRSNKRMDVVLRTNAQMSAGYANYVKQQDARKAFPCKQMVRLTQKREPRNWPLRWAAYEGQDGVNSGAMAATIDNPVWTKLSRFSQPYAPYDFNSGMGDRAIDRGQSIELGLISPTKPRKSQNPDPAPAGGSLIEEGEAVVKPGLNETLEADPKVTSPEVKAVLEKDLKGLAKLALDGKLVSTDPNGTKPVAAVDLAETISTPNSAGIPLEQKKALETWAKDGPDGLAADDKIMLYFRRMLRRVIPMEENEPLHILRTMDSPEAREELLKAFALGARWTPWAGKVPFTAFFKGPALEAEAKGRMVLQILAHRSAKDLTPAIEEITGEDSVVPGVIFERGASFIVDSVEETANATTINFRQEGAK